MRKNIFLTVPMLLLALCLCEKAFGQTYALNAKRQSARSDKLTGGKIEKAPLAAGESDIKITVNVPAFQLTLWQSGKEVKTYPIGVGMKDFPLYIGLREASDVIWNPNWIPPPSEWVTESKTVKAGEIIKPTDPRNPLGKLKIPLGGGYLIHQAKGVGDLGSLVSHGCVRMLKTDLYDLAEKIVAARSLPVTAKQITRAKATKETLAAELDPPVPVEITYDTQVVEAGRLHIYPDVYERNTNTAKILREELESSGIKTAKLTDKALERMMARAAAKKQFVVSLVSIKAGRELSGGRILPVVTRTVGQNTTRATTRRGRTLR